MWKKKEEKKEEKEESLLKELCGDDAKLYAFLSSYLLIDLDPQFWPQIQTQFN